MSPSPGQSLALDHVSHSVLEAGAEKRTMAQLNRRFEPGLLNVVGGPSGAGKTTLLSILSLTVRATQGMIHFGETNLTALSPAATKEWRRKHIGMVFQTSRLVSLMSVREHILLSARIRGSGAAIAQGLQRLKDFGLGDKLDSRPDKLSGGEKQRVALAQALSFDPPVLLADEPTAALDQHNAELVAHTLRAYAREKGAVVVCVSHDRALFDAADDILKLEKA
jgi:putative ABC transport system ATP-binding protein